MYKIKFLIGVLLVGLFSSPTFAVDLLNQSMSTEADKQVSAAKSQAKIDDLHDETRKALQAFRLTQTEIEQLEIYNKQLKAIIKNQEEQKASLGKQIKDIEATQRGIMPLMERMLAGLQQFVELDTPFLLNERQERIASLQVLLLDADTSVSEKFRRVLEAFQIEIEYGRTIEAYRAVNHKDEMVDFLRLGRVALYSISLDGKDAMTWDKNTKEWIELSGSFNQDINKGLRIARKQASPQLLNLALPGLGE